MNISFDMETPFQGLPGDSSALAEINPRLPWPSRLIELRSPSHARPGYIDLRWL